MVRESSKINAGDVFVIQLIVSGLSIIIIFQSVPMVVDSHFERDNIQVHFCCNFTLKDFTNAKSTEIP